MYLGVFSGFQHSFRYLNSTPTTGRLSLESLIFLFRWIATPTAKYPIFFKENTVSTSVVWSELWKTQFTMEDLVKTNVFFAFLLCSIEQFFFVPLSTLRPRFWFFFLKIYINCSTLRVLFFSTFHLFPHSKRRVGIEDSSEFIIHIFSVYKNHTLL